MRLLVFPLVAVIAVLLAGCTTSPPSPVTSPTPTAVAEPTNLDELADAAAAEGLVDSAVIYLSGGSPDSITIQLFWGQAVSASEQLAAFTEVSDRVDDVVENRPEETRIGLLAERDDGEQSVVVSTYDPGEDILRDMVETAVDSPCLTASLDRGDFGRGEMAKVTLGCKVDAADAVGLAEGYNDITSHQIAGVDVTEWEVSLTDRSTTDANLRLDAGPIEGRQQLFVEVMTIAVSAGADRFTLIDDGDSISIYGFAEADRTQLCSTMVDRMHAAGVQQAFVSMQMRDTTPEDWACRVAP